jgi:microsomal dipeptidase-like Zn-dependent dipeptidase
MVYNDLVMKKTIHFSILLILLQVSLTQASNSAPKKATGYADLHVHMFANLGFGGAWFTGDPTAKSKDQLFKICSSNTEPSWLYKFLHKIDPYIASFIYRDDWIPSSEHFPTWNNLAHQQVWQKDLKQAHADGLSLMILSAVHSYVLCRVLPDSRKTLPTCEDRPNIVRQLQAANEWIKNESSWIGIATTPQMARLLNQEGKLAIILSVETENIFDHPNWEEEFQQYWDLGVRSLQIVHQFDNKLAGAAIHQRPLIYTSYLRNWLRFSKFEGFSSKEENYSTVYDNRLIKKNTKGLSDFGKTIIKKMMDYGMTIDFAHMSEETMKDVQVLLSANQNYPFYFSHGHLRDVLLSKNYGSFEKSSSLSVLKSLKDANGIFGLRTIEVGTHKHAEGIDTNCDGSSLSFAHMYQYGIDLGLNLAFGSDLNGFVAQTKPRFSDSDPNYCAPQKIPKLNLPFDTTGLGNINQLSSLIMDLKNLGLNLDTLMNSTENYIQVWERSYAKRKI